MSNNAAVVPITSEIASSDFNDENHNNNEGGEQEPLTSTERYVIERENAKIKHWKEHPYAVGCVEPTWEDELISLRLRRQANINGGGAYGDDNNNSGCCSDTENEGADSTCGCVRISAMACSRLGARRIGNMVILKESIETVFEESDDQDDEDNNDTDTVSTNDIEEGGLEMISLNEQQQTKSNNSKKKKKVSRKKIDLIVGPFWPMLIFVTYPLIFGVSLWTAVRALPGKSLFFIGVWCLLSGGLVVALFNTGFRDPGIMLRKRSKPSDDASVKNNRRMMWRWSDNGQTWKPRHAVYDPDCACVIEGFDHTCPWTGTAIGKKNMVPFQCFVALIFINLIMDIILLTSAGFEQ